MHVTPENSFSSHNRTMDTQTVETRLMELILETKPSKFERMKKKEERQYKLSREYIMRPSPKFGLFDKYEFTSVVQMPKEQWDTCSIPFIVAMYFEEYLCCTWSDRYGCRMGKRNAVTNFSASDMLFEKNKFITIIFNAPHTIGEEWANIELQLVDLLKDSLSHCPNAMVLSSNLVLVSYYRKVQ